MLFFLLRNIEMPTYVGILTFMSRKISCSAELSMNSFFITSVPGLAAVSTEQKAALGDILMHLVCLYWCRDKSQLVQILRLYLTF